MAYGRSAAEDNHAHAAPNAHGLELVFLVLANRQLTPSQDDDARIEACSDLATLERWLGRAILAASISDVLE